MSTWHAVWEAVAADFTDLDAAQAARVGVRLLFAAVLGGLIGFERENKGKPAGMRTHMLVAIGAALFVIVVQQSNGSMADVSRVIQGLVAGIGFLGAGTILNGRHEGEVKGLTTAASIWLTAAIGVAAGLGRESTAILTTLLALVVLAALPWLADRVLPLREPVAPPDTPSDARPKEPEGPAKKPVSRSRHTR
jgi:putative Mg2+ transporter-C (MgtC) family protein